jgi:DNA adenine methylase
MENSPLFREKIFAKPFLKWAGGKGQIVDKLEERLPPNIKNTFEIDRYIEPFVGGGALFFYLNNKYNIKQSVLIDINEDLIMAYKVIKRDVNKLIDILYTISINYYALDKDEKKDYYYKIRKEYNNQKNIVDYSKYNNEFILRTAYLIFLNRTCFNGLYRTNRSGDFNVPFGRYKNPKICDKDNLKAVSIALKNTLLLSGNYTLAEQYIKNKCFIYFDPPYRPISKSSSFTSYTRFSFGEIEQIKLAYFYDKCSKLGAYILLSNSDPKNEDPNDDFFEKYYKKYNIEKIFARRNINCEGSKRGEIYELIIRNY